MNADARHDSTIATHAGIAKHSPASGRSNGAPLSITSSTRKNYQALFTMRLPHMDTVDVVMRRPAPSELETLKRSLVRTLPARRTLHTFRLFGMWLVVAADATGVVSFSERHGEHCLTTTSKHGTVTYFRLRV